MFVPSGTAEAFLSRGEAPNKKVSEKVAHAPPTKLAAFLEGVQRGSVPVWPPLGQRQNSSYFAALVSYVN